MQIYYEDARLTVTENDGKYSIFDRKYDRETHKNVSKEWTDNFINRAKSRKSRPLAKKQKPNRCGNT